MKKLLFQLVTIIILFFSIWYGLDQINWMKLFKIEHVTETTEEKLGKILWDFFKNTDIEIEDIDITQPLDSLLEKICKKNDIDRKEIKLHIVKSSEINAFALPDKHLVINSELILNCDNEAELSGVICHEIAHMELNHVMKKLIKEIGLTVLISITQPNGGTDVIKEVAKLLTSTSYDRKLEREADRRAVDYLMNANIDPEHFANFLYKLADTGQKYESYLAWISTHPDSKERAELVVEYFSDKERNSHQILSEVTWDNLMNSLKEL